MLRPRSPSLSGSGPRLSAPSPPASSPSYAAALASGAAVAVEASKGGDADRMAEAERKTKLGDMWAGRDVAEVGTCGSQEHELLRFLLLAGINPGRVGDLLALLDREDVDSVNDLALLDLERCFTQVTASKIRKALDSQVSIALPTL